MEVGGEGPEDVASVLLAWDGVRVEADEAGETVEGGALFLTAPLPEFPRRAAVTGP